MLSLINLQLLLFNTHTVFDHLIVSSESYLCSLSNCQFMAKFNSSILLAIIINTNTCMDLLPLIHFILQGNEILFFILFKHLLFQCFRFSNVNTLIFVCSVYRALSVSTIIHVVSNIHYIQMSHKKLLVIIIKSIIS